MIPYKVLGVFNPRPQIGPWPWGWKAWWFGKELTALTRGLGLVPHPDPIHGPLDVSWSSEKLHAEVRRTTTYGKGGDDWHQDGDTTPGAKMDCGLVFWSNSHPTQLRLSSGKIVQPEPYEVVLALNLAVYHRRPGDAPKHRFLFRQRVKTPPASFFA